MEITAAIIKLIAALIPALLAWWAERDTRTPYEQDIDTFNTALADRNLTDLSAAFERLRVVPKPEDQNNPVGIAGGSGDPGPA